MRKWRFTRPAVSPGITAAMALLIAVAVHALFLIPGYRMPQSSGSVSGSRIRMLNFNSMSSDEKEEFSRWLKLHEPSRAARSFSASGYSILLPEQRWFNIKIEPYSRQQLPEQPQIPDFSLLPAQNSFAVSLPRMEKDPLPEKEVIRRRVLIFDRSGKQLPDLIKTVPLHLGSALPTEIRISVFGNVKTLEIVSSCGVPELDLMAWRAASGLRCKESTVLTVIWPGGRSR